MNTWEIQSCRACLLQDSVSAMYDLAVEDTLNLFNECSKTLISLSTHDEMYPQFICPMCYKMCELLRGFRERCYESEIKIKRDVLAVKRKKTVKAGRQPVRIQQQKELQKSEIMREEEGIIMGEGTSQDAVEDTMDDLQDDPLFKDEMTSLQETGTHWSDCEGADTDPEYEKPQHLKVRKYKRQNKKRTSVNSVPENQEFVEFKNGLKIWKYFLRCKTGRWGMCRCETTDGTVCGRILSMGSASSTGPLLNHLKLHKISPKDFS